MYVSVNAIGALEWFLFGFVVKGFVTATAKCIHSWHTVHVLTTHSDAYCYIVIVHWQLSQFSGTSLMPNLTSSFSHAQFCVYAVCSQYHTALVVMTGCSITYAELIINAKFN